MGAAMIEMALAIKMLADVDFADIVKSVFGLAAALGVLIAGCWGLGFGFLQIWHLQPVPA